jgi:hypothetical protein
MKQVTRLSMLHISCHKILEVASLREAKIIIKCITKLHSQIYIHAIEIALCILSAI